MKQLIDCIQKQGLNDNPYYKGKIQEYIGVYKDLFSGTDLKKNMVSKIQPDATILVSHAVPPKPSKISERLHGVKVDYSVFTSDKCPDPNIIVSKYDADEYSDESEFYKARMAAYRYLSEVCWNVGDKFNYYGNACSIIITFEQYISNLKAERGLNESGNSLEKLLKRDMKLFERYFIPQKDSWWDNLIVDIEAHLKSGKGGYTITAIAKVLYDNDKLHPTMKPSKFAPWLRLFCNAWGIAVLPKSKPGHNQVKKEITRIQNVFYYLNTTIPK